MAKNQQTNHPFRNRRQRFLGLDRGAWIKGFFAMSSAAAIFILLSIIGALLKEGYDFVPTNHHRLETLRQSGGEFANLVDEDLALHNEFYGNYNRAYSRQLNSGYQLEGDRRQAAVSAFNALRNKIKLYRTRLEIERGAGRSLEKLETRILGIYDKWDEAGGIESVVAEVDSANPEALNEKVAIFQGAEAGLADLLAQGNLELGLNRFVWIRDEEGLALLAGQQPVASNAGSELTAESTELSADDSEDAVAATAPATTLKGILSLDGKTLIAASAVSELLGKGYKRAADQELWIWLGEANGVPVKDSEEVETQTPNKWSAWLWSSQPEFVEEFTKSGLLTLERESSLLEVLNESLRTWSVSSASKPWLIEGIEKSRAAAIMPVVAQYKLDKELLDELKGSADALAAMQKVSKDHIIETYATAKAVDLAPKQMVAFLQGSISAIEEAALKKALEKVKSAEAIELIPVNYAGRSELIYQLRDGSEFSDKTALEAEFLRLANIPTQEVEGADLSQQDFATTKSIPKMFKTWEEAGLEFSEFSFPSAYEQVSQRMGDLEAQIRGELPTLSERYQAFLKREDAAALLQADTQLQEYSKLYQEALSGSAENADEINLARSKAASVYEYLQTLELGEGGAELLAAFRATVPLTQFDAPGAEDMQAESNKDFAKVSEHFTERPEKLAEWSYDKPRSMVSSVWAFLAGKRWVTNNSPWFDLYGFLPLLAGSMTIALIAILLCVPFAVGAAIFVNQFSNKFEMNFIKPAIEFIEALPSVVLGFFGVVLLGGELQNLSEAEWLAWIPGFPLEQRLNAFVAGVLLALMAVPTVFTLTEDAINNVPKSLVEASESLGASRVQTVTKVLMPTALSGIIAAILLGFGRVIGETMVVLMVAGGSLALLDFGQGLGVIFEPTHTMTGIIAQEIPEVSQKSEHWAALFMIGVVLFFLSLGINAFSRWVVNKFKPQF